MASHVQPLRTLAAQLNVLTVSQTDLDIPYPELVVLEGSKPDTRLPAD